MLTVHKIWKEQNKGVKMGLDQSIYKMDQGYASIVKQLEDVRNASNKYVNDKMDLPEIQKILDSFIIDTKYAQIDNPDSVVDTLKFNFKSILYGNDDYDTVKWDLFNNMSIFNYNTPETDKEEITNKLLNLLKDYSPDDEQKNRILLETSLVEKEKSMRSEVCYWRKYHDLNKYILSVFGGDNCEDTPLTKEDVEQIYDFIKDDNKNKEYQEDVEQVEDLLQNWDENCTYCYTPWW